MHVDAVFQIFYLPSNGTIAKVVFHYVDLTFSWSKLQMITKLFPQICLHLYGTRCRVILVFCCKLAFILTCGFHLQPEMVKIVINVYKHRGDYYWISNKFEGFLSSWLFVNRRRI